MAHNSANPEDARVRRTRDLLEQAVFALTVEKGFTSVTVSDITQRARVNRSTFYRHYLDKHELLERHLDDLQARVKAAAQRAEAVTVGSERVPAGLVVLLEHIHANGAFFAAMLGPKGDPAFTERFRRIAEARYRTVLGRQKTGGADSGDDLKVAYIAHATVGAILWWLKQKRPPTIEAFAVALSRLSMTVATKAVKA